MTWPRIKKPWSSTLPAAREHEGVHVTAAPDASPDPGSGHNTGISGTQHTVVDVGPSQAEHMNAEIANSEATGTGVIEGTVITGTPADAFAVAPRPDPRPSGPAAGTHAGDHDLSRASGSYDETAGIVYEAPPAEGFAALGLDPDPPPAAPGDAPEAPAAEAPAAEAPVPGRPTARAATSAPPTIVISSLDQARTLPQGDRTGGQPTWNQTTASVHGSGDEERRGLLGTFRNLFRRDGDARDDERDRPPLTRVRDLPLDQKLRIWRNRALIVIAVGIVFSVIADWEVGLTLAIVAGIADSVYRARTVESHHWTQPGTVDRATWRAQKRTQRQLSRMKRAGYASLYRRPIPDSVEVIDHLVVGPTGVYAIDSEKWDKDLPVRAKNGKTLFHGPQSMKDRLEHARWEAGQASELLSQALGREIAVRPALAIYGPPIPWDIAVIRDVDVFSGNRLRKYLRSRARKSGLPRLTGSEVTEIRTAAAAVLPLAAGMAATPVG